MLYARFRYEAVFRRRQQSAEAIAYYLKINDDLRRFVKNIFTWRLVRFFLSRLHPCPRPFSATIHVEWVLHTPWRADYAEADNYCGRWPGRHDAC